jgi:predicted PP-loop superfamily ATPase
MLSLRGDDSESCSMNGAVDLLGLADVSEPFWKQWKSLEECINLGVLYLRISASFLQGGLREILHYPHEGRFHICGRILCSEKV